MLRWNDKLRPTELWEIDKQGHKMILAFLLWHQNSRSLPAEEAVALAQQVIEGGIFDYLYRLVITDLKPPVFYRIKQNPQHFKQLTKFVLTSLEPTVRPMDKGFWRRLCAWHTKAQHPLALRILTAAHWYTSRWEFNILKQMNQPFDDEIPQIAATFEQHMDACRDLEGMKAILDERSALGKFANLCGQLRFQIRWTQAPRIPATSVLGHMFLVAVYAYFCSVAVDACTVRRNNNFFCGLFHDLPELLTRDIISPVKRSVANLPALIRQYEEEELEQRIFAPLRDAGYADLVRDMSYLLGLPTGSEFHETTRTTVGKVTKQVSFEELNTHCNDNAMDPKDGRLIKDCDLLAAFLEAHSSIRNGVASPHLQEAMVRLRFEIRKHSVDALQLSTILADFD